MTAPTTAATEVHDPAVLAWASDLLDRAGSPRVMHDEVLAAVARNARWRGDECLNLLALEAPMSPTVRNLLAAEVGQRRRPERRAGGSPLSAPGRRLPDRPEPERCAPRG